MSTKINIYDGMLTLASAIIRESVVPLFVLSIHRFPSQNDKIVGADVNLVWHGQPPRARRIVFNPVRRYKVSTCTSVKVALIHRSPAAEARFGLCLLP